MMLPALVSAVGLLGVGIQLELRRRGAQAWTSRLSTFRVQLPRGLSAEDVAAWLGMLAASTTPRRFRMPQPIRVEVRASARGIEHRISVPAAFESALLASLRGGLPGARLERVDDAPSSAASGVHMAASLRLSTVSRPLAAARAEATSSAFLAALQPLAAHETVCASWLLYGAGAPPAPELGPAAAGDSARRQALRTKHSEPLLWGALTVAVAAASGTRARTLLTRSTSPLKGMDAPGVRLRQHRHRLHRSMADAAREPRMPLLPWSFSLINTGELVGLIGFPLGNVSLPGLAQHTARQLPPISSAARGNTLLARSNYPGSHALFGLSPEARLTHTLLTGPTGTGKSTLMAAMALQDIQAGHGTVVIDPKTDLVTELLARIPESRQQDVVVLDPAATDQPIGCNLLGSLDSEAARELAVDHITHIMHELWQDSWGPRTSDVIRNSLLTLVHARAADGSAFTLIDTAPLLEDPVFRRFVTAQPTGPEAVRPFWQTYERASEAQRIQIVGPALNKLRALTTRTSLRLMLGQSAGLDIPSVLNDGKILLVALNKGVVGVETAQLLGALLVSALVNATFARTAIPAAKRRPAYLHLDEFQDVLRLPLDLADLFAQARGLGVGLTVAHQHLGQLSEPIKRSVLGTVRSSIVFQMDYDDAKVFERRFAPLTAEDLMALPRYEIAARLAVDGQTQRPVTGVTLPPPEPITDPDLLADESRMRHGTPRAEVEAAIRARLATSPDTAKDSEAGAPFGRRKRRSEP